MQNPVSTPSSGHNPILTPSPNQNSPSNPNSPKTSAPGGKLPVQTSFPTGGTISSIGKNVPTRPPIENYPPTSSTMIVPPFGQAGPSWVPPTVTLIS